MARVLGINPHKPIHDEGRWQCETCGKEFGYTQPINFKLQLAMLKLFMDWHEANCEPIGAAPTTTGEAEPEVGQIWRNKKSGDEVQVILRPGPFGVNYRRYPLSANSDFNRERKKRLHYFLYEYEMATTTGEGKPANLDLASATHIHAIKPAPAFDPAREAFYPGTKSALEGKPAREQRLGQDGQLYGPEDGGYA